MQGRTNSTSVYSKNADVTFTENGIYVPSEDYTGFGVVTVDTPTVEDIVMQEDYYILPTKVNPNDPQIYQYDEYQEPYVDTKGNSFSGVNHIKVRRVGSWIDSEINADNIKVGHAILGVTGNVVEVHNQANKTTKSAGSTIYVRPDNGYTGLSQVTVNPIQVQTKSTTINQTKSTSYPIRQSIYTDSGYDGMTRVDITVNAPPPCPTYVTTDLQIRPSIEDQVFKPSSYSADGFGTVSVEKVTSSIDPNIQPGNIAPGITILGVEGTYKPQHLQNKIVEPNTIQDQVVTADSEYEALGEVTVKKVTSAIDSDIQAGNIREGVDILGVVGTYHGPDYNIETVTGITPQTVAQTVTPSPGYDYMNSVTIKGVTAAIDQNIQAENIKEGVTILGVEGTFATQTVKTQDTKTVTPTTEEQHVRADAGYDAIVELVVRAVTAGIDPNIIAENIKKNITILGVRGTLDATQKWFDFQEQAGFTVLTSDTFGNGQFSPELTADLTDYVITTPYEYGPVQPIEDLGAVIFSTIFGYENIEATDPIIYQTYIAFNGGYYYSDYSNYITIPNQVCYLYPVVNDYNVNGCLLNCEDTGFEKTYNIYVIMGTKEPRPVLVDGTINISMLPSGYNSFRYVGQITIPDHNVFKFSEDPYYNVNSNIQKIPYTTPKLSANGTIGGEYFAVASSSYFDTPRQAWRAFDQSNQDGELDCWHSTNSLPQWIEWYFPEVVYIEKIYIQNRVSSYDAYSPKVFEIQTSDDGITWNTIYSGTNNINDTSTTWTIDLSALQNKSSKYWRMYVTDSNGSDNYVVIGEISFEAYTIITVGNLEWSYPTITSSTTYGNITWGNTEAVSDDGWAVFNENINIDLSNYEYVETNGVAFINEYVGLDTDIVLPEPLYILSNFVPSVSGSYIKWQMPGSIKLAFTKNGSKITWQHAADSNIMSGMPLQLFADEAKTIPLTNAFADPDEPGKEIVVPVISDCITNTIYISIAPHENAGGISKIRFSGVYISQTTSTTTSQNWLLDNSVKPNAICNVIYDNGSDVTLNENNITFYTIAMEDYPLRVAISAFDTNMGKPNILSEKTVTVQNVTAVGGISLTNGSVSGFSGSAYANANQILQGNLEITLRAYCSYNTSYAQYCISDNNGSGFGIGNNSSRTFRICNIYNTIDSATGAYDNGTWQWLKLVQTGTTTRLYTFRDTGTYTSVDSLPPVTDSTWVQRISLSTQIFKGTRFKIGSRTNGDPGYQGYWRNSIDFSNLKIELNGLVWKPYGSTVHLVSNHNVVQRKTNLWFISPEDATYYYQYNAKLFGYIDNGDAITINVYAVYDTYNDEKTYVFAPDDGTQLGSIDFGTTDRFVKLGWAGTVDIPEHTVYVYDINQGWVPKV